MVGELRKWQREALEKFLSNNEDFLCVATPGSGKTRFALAAAARSIERGEAVFVVVVVPTKHMRNQWAKAAHHDFGIQLDPKFSNGVGVVAKDFDGVVVTYQSVASQPKLYRRLSTVKRTLVILDEVHHGGDSLTWGNALREAFDAAARRLLLSGTPYRTDGEAIPFVRYDKRHRFVADYSYDYGQALADREGVVRQIEFPAFDGEARWLDATSVISKLKLSDVDELTRARALSSALMPDGPWIASVLRVANDELTRQREFVPDAGGLVIADDQPKAVRYAGLLAKLTGEQPTLAISDLPEASANIEAFTGSTSRWIVAVRMVSEGVDIPRLVVGVYATTTATDLYFRQAAGRFVRTRSLDDVTSAVLFIPSVEPLLAYAAEIEQVIPRALREAEERAEREVRSGGEMTQLQIDFSVPMHASEAVHLTTILSGDQFADAELQRAQEIATLAGLPGNVTPAQAARFLRMVTGERTVQRTTVEIPAPSLADQKTAVRKALQRRIGYLARLVDQPHSHINAELNRRCADTVPKAALESLRKRQQLVEEWIVRAQP
jgi:superfamily II DNA or RNA helicase